MFSSHQLDLVERLCDRVGIISDGEMVAVGDIETLRRDRAAPVASSTARPPRSGSTRSRASQVVRTDGARTVVEVRRLGAPRLDQELLARRWPPGRCASSPGSGRR